MQRSSIQGWCFNLRSVSLRFSAYLRDLCVETAVTQSTRRYAEKRREKTESKTLLIQVERSPQGSTDSAIHFCGSELFGHLRQFVGEGVDHELEAIGYAELCIDGAEMVRDGGWTNEESFGNLSILESLCNQRDDLSFPVCES